MSVLCAVYGRLAAARRRRYARRADLRRRLRHPVISIGNLSVGGSGKTPVVAAVASLLQARGERPAVVSRGYARREHTPGVVIVSDGARVLATVEQSGDEPQMLARALPGVAVLVCPDRYAAGTLAEQAFGATVTILDDGFQHVQLERDVDLLLVGAGDLTERLLPWGRLREPLETARLAHAVVATGTADDAARVAAAIDVRPVFTVRTAHGAPRLLRPFGAPASLPAAATVVACAGIARPERFFGALGALGFGVARTFAFPDHHWFRAADVATVEASARASGAAAVVTTEKDAARLSGGEAPRFGADVPWVYVPMTATLEPAQAFETWLIERLQAARQVRPA